MEKKIEIQEEDKPQNSFADKIDNSETPFVPKIINKQCSNKPIPKSIEEARKNPDFFFKYV